MVFQECLKKRLTYRLGTLLREASSSSCVLGGGSGFGRYEQTMGSIVFQHRSLEGFPSVIRIPVARDRDTHVARREPARAIVEFFTFWAELPSTLTPAQGDSQSNCNVLAGFDLLMLISWCLRPMLLFTVPLGSLRVCFARSESGPH